MPSRRHFLSVAGSAAAAVTLGQRAAADGTAHRAVTFEDPAIKAFEDRLLRAKPVPLAKIRLTGGPLKAAQDSDAKYLLSLEPDRMMAYYRIRAGLEKKAEPYGGWDGDHHNLTGHIAGHHLSAVSLMYAATGDARFKERADYLVREMKEVQDKNGDGLVSGLEIIRQAFGELSKGEIRSAAFDLNGVWSPWYTLHKTFAGLRDAYRHAGNKTALEIETKYAKWAEGVLAPLTEAQVQHMLLTEHGGMNEVLADLYADTGDKRWLNLSLRFEHHAFTDSLKRFQDNLSGKHGNCQIPKLVGSAARYGYNGDPNDLIAASFFWDCVAQHHSYATGGHGLDEYFGAPDVLSPRVNGRTCESCNVYNMLKLTRRLFSLRPDAFYADFHERALFNHALASFDPDTAQMSYMVPVGRGEEQEYQGMTTSFTCCVGTGMENHALHGDGIYYESGDALWVNIFAPSTAQLANGGTIAMETGFPDGDDAKITLTLPSPKTFTLNVRRPVWAGDAFALRVNGAALEQPTLASLREGGAGGRGNAPGNESEYPHSTFVGINRTWKSGDIVELSLPKTVRLEPTPDNKQVAAIMWGPLVLAGNLGPRQQGRGPGAAGAPMLVTNDRPASEWVVPAGTRAGDFAARQVGRLLSQPNAVSDVALTPFYRTQQRVYSVYFDVLHQSDFDGRVATVAAERERQRKLEAATVAFVQPGNMQAERDRNFQSEPANRAPVRANGRTGRGGSGWFSYEMPVDATQPMALVVTYLDDSANPAPSPVFQILVDGTAIGRFREDPNARGFYDATYTIPDTLVQGKSKVTVKFDAGASGRIGPVFGVRVVRAKEM